MRQIGSIANEQQARVFVDYLLTQGISTHAESEGQHVTLWVRDENQVQAARQILAEFIRNPADGRYHEAADEAERIRDAKIRHTARIAQNTVVMRRVWAQPLSRRAPLVFALIGLSVFASLVTHFGQISHHAVFNALMFCDRQAYEAHGDGLQQIKQGQLWRLVTPIFLHGGWMHLLFNMSWLYTLGTQIEMRRGTVFLGALVLALAVASNLAQFAFGSPLFLGMSGVAYGLFGYVWIRQRIDPRGAYMLSETIVFFMLFILVLGFVGALDDLTGGAGVANYCHAGGLFAGMAIARFVS